jgi:hypothetical protein
LTFKATGLDTAQWTQSQNFYLNVIPEPGIAALFATGCALGLTVCRRKRRRG